MDTMPGQDQGFNQGLGYPQINREAFLRQAQAGKETQKKVKAENQARVEKLRTEPGEITYAPVPRAMVEHIVSKVGRDDKLLKYAFKFVSHLQSHALAWSRKDTGQDDLSKGVPVHQGRRMKLAKETGTKRLAALTKKLIDLGIIVRVDRHVFTPGSRKGLAETYRIHDDLIDAYITSPDTALHKTLRDSKKGELYHSKPHTTLDMSFDGRLPEAHTWLKDYMLELQQRPLVCNLHALKQNLASQDPKKRQRWYGAVSNLVDGPNFTAYTFAASGRLYTTAVNLQGIPKQLRRHFRAPSKDHVLIDFDYGTQEAWILAQLSGDEKLRAAVREGLYDIVAKALGIDRNTQAKPLVNAYHYDAGWTTLARQVGNTDRKDEPTSQDIILAEQFMKFYEKEFRQATAWKARQVSQVRRSGVADPTPLIGTGVIREGIPKKEAACKGFNHLIQGVAAVILWRVLQDLDAALGDIGRVVLPIHDGLLVEVRKGSEAQAIATVKAVMIQAARQIVRTDEAIAVKVSHGWGT